MALWYGVPGVEFHFNGPNNDWEITYAGVRDDVGMDVEDALWDEYEEAGGDTSDVPAFNKYVREHPEDVYSLIRILREAR